MTIRNPTVEWLHCIYSLLPISTLEDMRFLERNFPWRNPRDVIRAGNNSSSDERDLVSMKSYHTSVYAIGEFPLLKRLFGENHRAYPVFINSCPCLEVLIPTFLGGTPRSGFVYLVEICKASFSSYNLKSSISQFVAAFESEEEATEVKTLVHNHYSDRSLRRLKRYESHMEENIVCRMLGSQLSCPLTRIPWRRHSSGQSHYIDCERINQSEAYLGAYIRKVPLVVTGAPSLSLDFRNNSD